MAIEKKAQATNEPTKSDNFEADNEAGKKDKIRIENLADGFKDSAQKDIVEHDKEAARDAKRLEEHEKRLKNQQDD